ncbi:MAG: DNA repair protein RecO [Actinomycetota bacterium]|nr:DNA repair protein RecO [Actinomycetota bacterium]
MPGLYRDEGIVLKTIKLGEADRIITLFTRQSGKVRAVAKGIRKTKSRFGARLEPFTQVRLMIYRGRNLDTITSADIMTSFDELRRGYAPLTAATAMVDAVEKITPDRETAYSTYALLLSGLHALTQTDPASIVPAFLVKLLSLSGYHPQLTECAGCERSGIELVGFSAALGGAVCEDCWREDRDSVSMSAHHIAALARLLSSDFGEVVEPNTTAELTLALRRYAEYHLERPLRSLYSLV